MSANSLLQPLRPEHVRLIHVVASVYGERHVWPTWQYVQAQMDRDGLDAAAILPTLPWVGSTHGIYGLRYGLLWPTSPTHIFQHSDIVGLTIAGLHRAGADDVVTLFMKVLDLARREFEDFEPQPDEVSTLEVTSADVASHLEAIGVASPLSGTAIYQLLEREPAFWGGSRGVSPDGTWRWEITRDIRRFSSVATIEDYVEIITALAERSAREVAQVLPAGYGVEVGLDTVNDAAAAALVSGDHPSLNPQVPLLGHGIDAELWEHVRPLVEASRWEQVAREAAAFVETRTKTWTGSDATALDLMTSVLKPASGSTHSASQGEAEGWHLLARGFFQAIRNHVMHNEVGVEREFQFGLGALGTASLLIGRIRAVLAERTPKPRSKSIPERLLENGVFAEGESLRIVVPAGVGEDRDVIQRWLDADPRRSDARWRADSREPVVWMVDGRAYNLTRLIRHIIRLATDAAPRTQVWGPNWYRDNSGRPLHKIAEGQ